MWRVYLNCCYKIMDWNFLYKAGDIKILIERDNYKKDNDFPRDFVA